jgi:hypothetical protein
MKEVGYGEDPPRVDKRQRVEAGRGEANLPEQLKNRVYYEVEAEKGT